MSKPPFLLENSYHLYFETFDKPYQQGEKVDITCNFDYEIKPDGKKWVYIDLGVKLNYASVVYRSGFRFKNKTFTWKDIFVSDYIQAMLAIAFEETRKGYKGYCEANRISIPADYTIPPTLLQTLTTTILDQYNHYRSVCDTDNAYLIGTNFLECDPEIETYLLLKYTFDILQEVLFYHDSFKTEYNREVFSDIVPLPRYFTLRNNCRHIEWTTVILNGYDTVMFFHCLDCALQMLMGDKSAPLIGKLELQGFDAQTQAAYIQAGTSFFTLLNESLKTANIHITSLENRVDWVHLIK